jgi:hypothetical protein
MIGLVVTLIVIGLLVWLEETYLPLPAPFKLIIRIIVIVAVIVWLLDVFGVLGHDVPIPRLR